MGRSFRDKCDFGSMALDFLVCCYFGQSKNFLKAAIDRGYVDMASHTLKDFKDNYVEKWNCRYNASIAIGNGIKNYPDGKVDFSSWHMSIIEKIESCYETIELNRGQSQKWLNMTIKYLFVFNQLYPGDYRLAKIENFLKNTSESDYKIPIDSYVIKGAGLSQISWSSLKPEKYNSINEEILEKLNHENGFIWELKNWESFSENKLMDKNSYAYHYNKMQEQKNNEIY